MRPSLRDASVSIAMTRAICKWLHKAVVTYYIQPTTVLYSIRNVYTFCGYFAQYITYIIHIYSNNYNLL